MQADSGHDGAAEQMPAAQGYKAACLGGLSYRCHEFAINSVNYVKFSRNYMNDAP